MGKKSLVISIAGFWWPRHFSWPTSTLGFWGRDSLGESILSVIRVANLCTLPYCSLAALLAFDVVDDLIPVFLDTISHVAVPWAAVRDVALREGGEHFCLCCPPVFPCGGSHGFPECEHALRQALPVWLLQVRAQCLVSNGLIHHQQSQGINQKKIWGHILCLYNSHARTKANKVRVFYIFRDFFFFAADTFRLLALQSQKTYGGFRGFDSHYHLEV